MLRFLFYHRGCFAGRLQYPRKRFRTKIRVPDSSHRQIIQISKKEDAEIKKLIALLLVHCVSAAAMTAYAEEDAEKTYADEHPGVLAFDSYWVSGEAKIRIDADHTDDGYEIVVMEMTGENTFNSWEYLLTYDEETKSLVADGNGMKSSKGLEFQKNINKSKEDTNMPDTITTLKTRRSCRAYKPEHVEEEKLQAILEAGTYTGSAPRKAA